MKTYPVTDLTGDSYLNPTPAIYDNGQHPRSVSQIKSISIHHDAMHRPHDYDSVARYHEEAAGHYARLGPGLQYHYKIDNTGEIFQTRPLNEWLYCVGSAENVSTIAICLDGYLHNDATNQGQDPTKEQFEALYQLLSYLCTQRPDFTATWPDVRPHNDFSSTACCGNRLSPLIIPIKDAPSAQAALLNKGTFDWPSFQPQAPTPGNPPAPTPQPTPPASTVTTPPVAPTTPPPTPAVQAHDYGKENNDLLKQILQIVQAIITKLTGVFK